MGDSAYRGVSASQDSRFSDKEASLLRKLKFPAHFDVKLDVSRVELSVMKPWMARRITELLGFEDEVVLEYAVGMLEEARFPDPKKMQIQLTGFLEASTPAFMHELWELLLSAQESPGGVPQRFVDEKKLELRAKREEGERVVREARERAQRAAQTASSTAQSDTGGARRRSRWDAGAPSEQGRRETDSRPPAYAPARRSEPYAARRTDSGRSFRDRHGNTTERSRDAGWGSRGPAADAARPADSWRPSRRSPSPPRRRRSPSPPPRDEREPRRGRAQSRSRSRSRSVTPDYRAAIRQRIAAKTAEEKATRSRNDSDRDSERGREARRSRSRSRSRTPDYRASRRGTHSVDGRRPRSDSGSDQDASAPLRAVGEAAQAERLREEALRSKLHRAKNTSHA